MSIGEVIIEIIMVTAECLFPVAVLFFTAGFIHGVVDYNKRRKE
jgi:hypothetical protein